ncbi:MAG: hypothetical protein D6806_12045 [Deltaproteobacteria bacterium]|nr:MAG: hypothetical protein D6806_12045 [Deltaproteobacteria bacterium]
MTRLRRTEKMRRDFVANVSDELRSPAAAIRAAAESLLAGALEESDQARRFAESIAKQASRLGRLVDDLLSLARIESGALQLDKQRVDVESLARRLAEQNASPASDRDMRIEIDIEKGLAVLADPAAFETILQNLLDNAIKYGEKGGTVTILARRTAGRIRIEVRDTGPGIEPRHRERVFERFYRVDKGRSREQGGTGLGLSIVKHLAEAMGGAVGLEQNSPRGSIFWVELDAAGKPETC